MIFIIALALAAAFILLCDKPLKAHPAIFYVIAAVVSAVVVCLYWIAPEFLPIQMRTRLPLLLGALGTACFVFVMYAGALPNGHSLMKKIMPIRGELSIFACLLTLGHNLSYGKNYLTPGYLFSGPVSLTKAAAWVSLGSILLMLALTITSVKAVRKRFQPKKWKALQRSAYLFYALIYIHVLLLAVPGILKGKTYYRVNLLVYSVVFLSYALCRVQKAALMKKRQAAKVTGKRQLAAAGAGVVLSLALLGGLTLSANAQDDVLTAEQLAEGVSQPVDVPELSDEPSPEADPEPSEPPSETPSPEPLEEPSEEPSEESSEEPSEEPSQSAVPVVDTAAPSPSAAVSTEPSPEPSMEPEPVSKYKDGTFTGTANGYDGPITVSVTISGDRITAISVTSYVDDDDYFVPARDGVIPAILSTQSSNVSAVSGATYSSEGIMDAVDAALKQALN